MLFSLPRRKEENSNPPQYDMVYLRGRPEVEKTFYHRRKSSILTHFTPHSITFVKIVIAEGDDDPEIEL
jgi:hypothetical protein